MVDGESDRRSARDEAHQRIEQAAHQLGFVAERPKRMGNGKFMTIARLKDDYRVFSAKLDLDTTLLNLKKAQQIIDLAFQP